MKKYRGFSLIELLIVVVMIGIIAAIAIPNLLAARRASNEDGAIKTLRDIYAKRTEAQPGTFEKSGYVFSIAATSDGFSANATPITSEGVSATGTRFFAADSKGDIYYDYKKPPQYVTDGSRTTMTGKRVGDY